MGEVTSDVKPQKYEVILREIHKYRPKKVTIPEKRLTEYESSDQCGFDVTTGFECEVGAGHDSNIFPAMASSAEI